VERIARVRPAVRERNRVRATTLFERLRYGWIPVEDRGGRFAGAAGTDERTLLRRDVMYVLGRDAEDRLVHTVKRAQRLLADSHIIACNFDVVIILKRQPNRIVH